MNNFEQEPKKRTMEFMKAIRNHPSDGFAKAIHSKTPSFVNHNGVLEMEMGNEEKNLHYTINLNISHMLQRVIFLIRDHLAQGENRKKQLFIKLS